MRIAFVSQPWNRMAPPVDIGSVAILTYETARRLAGSNDVTIYSKRDPSQKEVERIDGVTYRRVSVRLDRMWLGQLRRFSRFRKKRRPLFSSNLFYRGYISRIVADLVANPCDVVQIFNFSQFAPMIRAANPRVKIVLRMSCEWLNQLDPAIIEPRLEMIDAIFGCSEFITERIRKAFPRFAERCSTIYNGRNVEAFGGPTSPDSETVPRHVKGEPRLIFVGRVSPDKGVHVLVDAFHRVLERFPGATLDIIGPHSQTPREYVLGLTGDSNVQALAAYYEGDYVAHIRDLLSPKAASRVRLRGSVRHHDLPHEYRMADVLVFPSIWDEPSGNPPIEAMAAGTPVVSTRTGGTSEYVEDGVTGILVDPGDVEQLSDAIIRLLADDDMRTRMGASGRKRVVSRFSYERFVDDLYGLYCTASGVSGDAREAGTVSSDNRVRERNP